jgi:cob(I)alamin adenosyltransferase
MKIYTKKGDQGQTSLIGGTRVAKSHFQVQAYGDVDELNAQLGLLADQIEETELKEFLRTVQEKLFTLGSNLAADPEKSRMSLPSLKESDIERLEAWIDQAETQLEPLQNFVLPGGHPLVSQAHIVRCVCRRAERSIVAMGEHMELPERSLAYCNRLSDLFFVLSRYLAHKLNVKEIPWISSEQ